jgi:hypothetical protein
MKLKIIIQAFTGIRSPRVKDGDFNIGKVVAKYAQGSPALQRGVYVTKDQIDARRSAVCNFNYLNLTTQN